MSYRPAPAAARTAGRRNLLSCAVLSALLAVPAVHAQQPAPQDDERDTASATTLGTVTVTARKRDERQLDVPIAMAAVTGEDIRERGLLNVTDVLNITPGAASIDTGGSFTQVQIRGVSSSLGGNDNGYYIDDTPFTGVTVPWYPDTRSFDIDRVEVLKGPQGTLFGEGSMGGTVRIITRKPEFNEFRAGVELDASSVSDGGDGHGAKAYANIPLVDDRLALRVALTDEKTPGWIDNGATGEKDVNENDIRTWRTKLRFAPTDQWTIDLAYWKYDSEAGAGSNEALDDMSNDSFMAVDHGWHSGSLNSSYDFGGSELFYGYSDANMVYAQAGELAPGLPFDAIIDITVRTHELRWSSTGERALDWTVGTYMREAIREDAIDAPGILVSTSQQTNEAYAFFGETTFRLPNPAWSLTAGLRYFSDDVDAWDRAEDGSVNTLQAKFDSWNPRVSLSWKPSENTTFYASGARGFRSGQLQPMGSILLANMYGIDLPVEIDPDSIMTYELGVKSLLADGRLLLEGALFTSDWEGVAVRVPITEQINGLANSDGTRNRGVEVNLVYNATPDLTLQLGGSWIDAVYSADVPDTPLFKGTPVYNVPKTSVTTSASYRWDIGANLRGTAFASIHHDSARKTSLTAGSPGDPITLANARIGIESPSGWAAYLYGNNLTNEDGAINARNMSFAANRPQPRTYGVLLRYDY